MLIGFGELVHELGGGGVADPAALLAGGHAQADEQVCLAGARVAERDNRLAGVDPRAGLSESPAYALRARAHEMPPNSHQQPAIATSSNLRT